VQPLRGRVVDSLAVALLGTFSYIAISRHPNFTIAALCFPHAVGFGLGSTCSTVIYCILTLPSVLPGNNTTCSTVIYCILTLPSVLPVCSLFVFYDRL